MLRAFSIISVVLACFAAGAALLAPQLHSQTAGRGHPLVLIADLKGAIGPATVRHVQKSIETAGKRGAELLVLRINTPGGLVTSTRDMIEDIIGASVPVIGYVAPPGAQAASAGTFIMYSTHIAAMAPGTNLGAATPIQLGGGFPGLPSPLQEDKKDEKGGKENGGRENAAPVPDNPAEAKAVNDAVAFIRSLAELRGRNAEWGEKAVRQAATLTADAAQRMNVVEIVAADMEDLLKALDGRRVTVDKLDRTLSTANARIEILEPGIASQLLAILTNPNVALILMMIGIYGLIFEFASPGSIGPGIVGIICLILGLYSLNQLPLDYAGLALILVGVTFMTVEAFTPSFGAFGIGGLIAFLIGATMLVDTDVPAFQLSWSVILGTAAASGLVLILLVGYAWRAHQKPVRTGEAQLTGAEAEVLDWSGSEGHVWIAGERWNAVSDDPLNPGETVRVRSIDGLQLRVRREAS